MPGAKLYLSELSWHELEFADLFDKIASCEMQY